MTSLFKRYQFMFEGAGVKYDSGVGYVARVVPIGDKHIAKFFKDGVHMKHSDYEGKDKQDAHEFAKEEMEFRKKESMNEDSEEKDDAQRMAEKLSKEREKKTKDPIASAAIEHNTPNTKMMAKAKPVAPITERINMPQGHKETADPITDDAKTGHGAAKKMMGNRSPMEIIARILAGRK